MSNVVWRTALQKPSFKAEYAVSNFLSTKAESHLYSHSSQPLSRNASPHKPILMSNHLGECCASARREFVLTVLISTHSTINPPSAFEDPRSITCSHSSSDIRSHIPEVIVSSLDLTLSQSSAINQK